MTDADLKELAHAIAEDYLETIEYSHIYEDEELDELTEEEQKKLYMLIVTAAIDGLRWDDD